MTTILAPRLSSPDSLLVPVADSRLLATAPRRLPPSYRDVEIYEWVTRAGCSTREAAARRMISQTRVRQIVRRVIEWLAEVLPEQPEADRQRETRLAQQMTADRLLHAYQQLMTLWVETQDPKYVSRATRITLALGKLGVIPGTIDGLLADAIEAAESGRPPSDPVATAPEPERGAAVSAAVQSNMPAIEPPESSDRFRGATAPTVDSPAPPTQIVPPVRDCSDGLCLARLHFVPASTHFEVYG